MYLVIPRPMGKGAGPRRTSNKTSIAQSDRPGDVYRAPETAAPKTLLVFPGPRV